MDGTSNAITLNDKRTINGWAIFDWANSAYALVIVVAIFPNYYIQMTDDFIPIGKFSISNSSLYAYSISLAYFIIAIILPALSGIADHSGRRKFFMKWFTTIGSLACIALFFFKGMPQVGIALLCFIVAAVGFDGGKVFYNSYLPLISSPDRYDMVSAKGFSYGYIGSVLLLIVNLLMITYPQWFGISDEILAIRISFVMVGIWWISFAQVAFRRLPKDQKKPLEKKAVRQGLLEIKQVWKNLKPQKDLKRFLLAFFCYSAGVQTVLYLAATFAEKELDFGTTELILIILILQLVAIGGAYLFAFVSKIRGNKLSLMVMLVIWVAICILAYFVHAKTPFYFIAALVGLVMGGIQSMSRSTYSKLIQNHTEETTSYFSFFEVLEKMAIVFGTFSFGFIDQMSGGMRNSMLTLAVYFIIGMIVLSKVDLSAKRVTTQKVVNK